MSKTSRRLYSYVMTSDTGFAPSVSNGVLSLATCKPDIRRLASDDRHDFVMGIRGRTLARKTNTGPRRLVYLAEISEKIGFDSYYNSAEFKGRKDNIYHRLGKSWIQDKNPYHKHVNRKTDLKSPTVLVSRRFLYFGRNAIELNHEHFTTFVRMSRKYKVSDLGDESLRKLESIFDEYETSICKWAVPTENRVNSQRPINASL